MTKLVRWTPSRELATMHRDMDRLMNTFFGQNSRPGFNPTAIALDVTEDDNVFTVTASVPGIPAEDIEVTLDENILTIKAETGANTEDDGEENGVKYHIRERRFGRFSRSLRLPNDIDGDAISASQENGVLTLTVPKAEAVKPRRIEIS